jgi:hypothetical protein
MVKSFSGKLGEDWQKEYLFSRFFAFLSIENITGVVFVGIVFLMSSSAHFLQTSKI